MFESMFSLAGKTVVVTGGAGHLGREMSRGLADFGARVIVLGRNPDNFSVFDEPRSSKVTGSIQCRVCDVRDEEQFARILEDVRQIYGPVHVLINSAAGGPRVALDELDKRSWLDGLDAHLHHYFTCSSAVARHMMETGGGVIINNASIWSLVAPNKKMYLDLNNEPPLFVSAAKAAIAQMTKHLAAFWARHNIRVNAISPGWFPQRRGPDRPDYMHEITSRIPMGRIGDPRELVGLVVYLASEASSYITGQNIVVDGGYTIW